MRQINLRLLLKKLLKNFFPPILLHCTKNLLNSIRPVIERAGEKSNTWYDRAFDSSISMRKHYTEAPKYFLWSVIADRLMFTESRSILDVGCGSGQFSHLLFDRGFKEYYGIDFSQKRIEWARKNCPEFTFISDDVLETDIFDTFYYDAVVCIEFLEHVERDIDVITSIKSGARFYGSVPNFPYVSHVRHFTTSEEVFDRYSKYFHNFSVTSLIADTEGNIFYLFEGIKT